MEDHVSAHVRKRSTHPRLTKMREKPADLTEAGDPGQVQETDVIFFGDAIGASGRLDAVDRLFDGVEIKHSAP